MARPVDIALKKQPKQSRAIATVNAIVEAAAYILRREGPGNFTANKVAEKAGVNISSFYQYYPNKEALLFHLVRTNWEKQLARLSPILLAPGADPARKLKDFIREFFLIEAAEADLRRAVRIAAIELRETEEFRALIANGTALFTQFVEGAMRDRRASPGDLSFNVAFAVTLVTSFAERTTDEGVSDAILVRQADVLSDMLIDHFAIS
jgi:AcrR family transcriptional regulator